MAIFPLLGMAKNGHIRPMKLLKSGLWFMVYLTLLVGVGAAGWSVLIWLVGEERLFSIPLIHNIFKACPLVFLAIAFHMAKRRIYGGEESEATPFLPLDEAMAKLPGIRYLRYMDDWVIFAESRRKLRRAIRVMNQVLSSLGNPLSSP